MRYIFPLAVPAVVAFAVYMAFGPMGVLPRHVLELMPYGIAGLAALTCWRFRRSRAVPVLVLVAACTWFSTQFPDAPGLDRLGRIVYPAVCVLVPFNVFMASAMGDRGVFTSAGLMQFLFMGFQAFCIVFAATGAFGAYEPGAVHSLLAQADRLLHWRFLPPFVDAWTWLPQPAVIAGGICVAALYLKSVVTDSPMDAGLGGGLAAMMVALGMFGLPGAPEALLSGAAFAVAVPLFQDSYRMAFLDELTGIPARRSLMADVRGLGSTYAIAMGDIDHFKKFNDTYGHDVGDDVLRMVATKLAKVAGGGKAYRYGGEEFTIVFPRKGKDEAFEHLNTIREAVAQSGFTVRSRPSKKGGTKKKPAASKTVNVTISLGVAERSADNSTPEEVMKAADKALYKAKKKGRNCVVKG